MESNLFQLIKSRKGRPFPDGLLSSIAFQIVSGLEHVHSLGYFHRDLKPMSILVSTTGLIDSVSSRDTPPKKDVVAIVKLGGFCFAKEIKSKPPYTQTCSESWYIAPEVLLQSRDHSTPVDIWALGAIMAELVNLYPLFPGVSDIDQIKRICEVLGGPGGGYRRNEHVNGGGLWLQGIELARKIGLVLPTVSVSSLGRGACISSSPLQSPPRDISSLFARTHSLIPLIRDLLKYDPDARLTARQCLRLVDAADNPSDSHPRPITSDSKQRATVTWMVSENGDSLSHLLEDSDSRKHTEWEHTGSNAYPFVGHLIYCGFL